MAVSVAVAVVLMVALLLSLAPQVAEAQNTACYMERGGLRWICGDGGTMLFRDGSTLTMESGSTLNITGFLTTTLDELTVNGNAEVTGTLDVGGEATVDDLIVTDDVTIGGDLAVTGTTGLVGNVDVTGNLEVVDHLLTQAELYLIPPTALTLTDGDIITPTAAVMEIGAAEEVTVTLATATDGQFLILVNIGDGAINIVDEETTRIATSAELGTADTLTLIGAGVSWYELSRSNN
jgi:hypothetical protein